MLQVTTRREETSVGRRLHPKHHRLMRLCTPCTSSPSIPSFSSTCTPSEIERPQRQGSHLNETQVALQRPRFASTLAQYEESADTTIVRARPRATSQMHYVRFDGNALFSSVDKEEKQEFRGGVAPSLKSTKRRRGIVARWACTGEAITRDQESLSSSATTPR